MFIEYLWLNILPTPPPVNSMPLGLQGKSPLNKVMMTHTFCCEISKEGSFSVSVLGHLSVRS